MNEINRVALFRLSVLGPLVSREQLQRGELQRIIRQLAQCEYAIPDSDRRLLGEQDHTGLVLRMAQRWHRGPCAQGPLGPWPVQDIRCSAGSHIGGQA